MSAQRKLSLAGAALVVLVVAVVNGPLLAGLWRLAGADDVFYASDSSTHFVRMMHARDYYLPSGHHWGWEPFWFQGYVPFLLYPHLTYTLLAVVAWLPVEAHRVFNLYAIAIYLALPITAGLLVRSRRGAVPAALVAAWLASASSIYGVGLRGVFHVGLLTQQAGLLVFVAVAYELIYSRRLDRTAVWMGLAALVHLHTAVVAGIVWLGEGVARWLRRAPAEPLRTWVACSMIAALIAAPTVVGSLVGWEQIGPSTSFSHPRNLLGSVLRGHLIAPWPTLAAVCAGAVSVALTAAARGRAITLLTVGVLLAVVALADVRFGGIVGRTLYYMLRLRTLPFALIWLALLAAWGWPRLPRTVRMALLALTLAGLPTTWKHTGDNIHHVARTTPPNRSDDLASLENALQWVAADAGAEISTLALVRPRHIRRGIALRRALDITRLPMLGGHGLELTSVHNARLVGQPERFPCETLRQRIGRYGVGYIVGGELYRRLAFEKCLDARPDFENEHAWVFATGHRWGRLAEGMRGFERNATWTELFWKLDPKAPPSRVVLPIAATAPWHVTIDGREVEISRSDDGMMSVAVPRRSHLLWLQYVAPPGEWASVAVSAVGLVLAGALIVRTRRRCHGEPYHDE